jgi:uncharacterized protein (UPF0335 family)
MDDFIKTSNGVVINTNKEDFEKFKMVREKAMREKQYIQRIEKLEKEMKEIKKHLYELSNKTE